MGLKKQCRCGTKIDINEQCCNKCVDFYAEKRKESYRMYDEKKRDKKAHAFYLSSEWQTVRDVVLKRYAGIDLYIYYTTGVIKKANTVHHIIEINEDSNRKLDDKNLLPVTQRTHEKIHRMYQNNKIAVQEMLFSFIRRWEEEMQG
ncbi:HNH endonuclease [Cellulosilyticum sp. ST5]|uniref:hypothetical protein n=1 Tax=Cellulosilyticum sp. ST5 TaxID=3055805 RepID=UPI003977964F